MERDKALEMAMGQIDKQFGKGSIMRMGERNNPSWPLFEKLGFTAFGESDEIYTRDSIENGWACPVDGNPCHCRGRLYIK